jgi:hypothetical protein
MQADKMDQQSTKSLVEMEIKYKKYKKKYQSLKRKISAGGGQAKMKSKCREKQRCIGTTTTTDNIHDMAKIEIDLNTENVTEVQF